MAWNTTVLVGQSGGPTAAINASLSGVYTTSHDFGARTLGMRYGIEGYLKGQTVAMDDLMGDPMRGELLRRTPSSWLGSCRFKLPEPALGDPTYEQLFSSFERDEVGAVIYIGGNDSMDTIAKLSTYGGLVGSSVSFIGVPKTIDNDLIGTDHTPGYGSAAKYIATTMREITCDSSVYDLKSVTFVEIMGRDAGWLTASSCLAGDRNVACPDIILLPEVPLSEDALIERLAELHAQKNTVVVAVSEGVRRPDGTLVCEQTQRAEDGTLLDAFGHVAALSGTSRYLASITRERLGCKTRAVELSTVQRCAAHIASATDLREASALGGAAVIAARDGMTGMMSAIERIFDQPYIYDTTLVDIAGVANGERKFPLEWISEDGMGVTEDFHRYARPLIGGEVTSLWVGGIPRHIAAL